jgi:hypothetical protein
MDCLTPDTEAPLRPSLDELSDPRTRQSGVGPDDSSLNLQVRILYLRSYLLMRALIGFVGIALPIVLLLGDGFLFKGELPARGSLSAYYYSGMRDVFVGSLCATAIFLVTYKVFEHSLDNTLSIIAGIAALGVALFSTGRPGNSDIPMTPLQDLVGEPMVTRVHYFCAAVFIVSLAVISFFFGMREGKRSQQRDGHRARMSPAFWRRFHWGCTIGIALAVIFIVVTKLGGWLTGHSLIIGEAAAVFAFGSSWLMKGLELDVLAGPKVAKQAWRDEAPVGATSTASR